MHLTVISQTVRLHHLKYCGNTSNCSGLKPFIAAGGNAKLPDQNHHCLRRKLPNSFGKNSLITSTGTSSADPAGIPKYSWGNFPNCSGSIAPNTAGGNTSNCSGLKPFIAAGGNAPNPWIKATYRLRRKLPNSFGENSPSGQPELLQLIRLESSKCIWRQFPNCSGSIAQTLRWNTSNCSG